MRICSIGHILFFRPFHRTINILLDDWQTDAFYLLVDIQGIYVRHATDIVDDGHDTGLQIRGVDIILTAYAVDELSGIETVGVYGSLYERLHECGHDGVTR